MRYKARPDEERMSEWQMGGEEASGGWREVGSEVGVLVEDGGSGGAPPLPMGENRSQTTKTPRHKEGKSLVPLCLSGYFSSKSRPPVAVVATRLLYALGKKYRRCKMPRRADLRRMEDIYEVVERHPGCKPSFIARLLGLHRSSVTRILPAMEEEGYLLAEDDRGRLFPFRKK